MQLISDQTQFHIEEPSAVAIGKFDGIHMGHRKLLEGLFAAKKEGLATAVFTFDPSPGAYFDALARQCRDVSHRDEPGYLELMTREEKRKIFAEMGIDYLVEYPFNRETAALPPEDYVNQIVLEQMQAKRIIAGDDVSFGKNGAGDEAMLRQLANAGGAEAVIIPKICWQQIPISSTLVREKVAEGEMEVARELLGMPYFIMGRVETGNRIGRTLGMPTANIYPDAGKLLPPNGVYFSTIRILGEEGAETAEEAHTYFGITNIGQKPTIREKRSGISAETFLFDFDGDLYGKELSVSLLHFHRKEQQFDGLEALKEQMHKDRETCREYGHEINAEIKAAREHS
ncbi:MAG: riboflavin biosynthesis protein RibF [Lachnospiraceae bacterium]|nr:riboflavin biosynthesis protein RibF [Lachnospiraceae bacterium]